MVNGKVHEFLEIRRRMVVDALGLKPRDLKKALGMPSPAISFILRGQRHLSREELQKVTHLIRERIEALFS